MRKADFYFKENLKELIEFGHRDENPRPKYEDGNPAHTIFTTQIVEKYDISRGEIPITEARKIAVISSIRELLAIYQTQTNSREGFESHKCFWWENWFNDDGNIGRAYSYNLESHRPNEMSREIVKIRKILIDKSFGEKELLTVNPMRESIDGKVYKDRYIVIGISDKTDSKNRKFYDIQFLNNGYISSIRADQLGRTNGKNLFERTTYNIGYLGNYESVQNFSDKTLRILKDKWESMFRRCYSEKYEHREKYTNVFVHQNWHSFENFLRDVRQIPQYHLAKEDNFKGWDLDKDYYGGNCYSKDTCIFLTKSDNKLYSNCKPFYCNDKVYISQSLCALDIGSNQGNVSTALYRNGSCNGYPLSFIDIEDGYVYRYELSRNQVSELLYDLENNMYSRRNMTSFFNWANHNKKELVECAYETIWTAYKKDGHIYLDMTLIQRSSDVLTANHINKMQYVALMLMVAKHCGYKVGKFVHFIQNYHIYDKHLSNLKVILERLERNEISNRFDGDIKYYLDVPDGTNFYDITWKDFKLEGYNPIVEEKEEIKLDKFELAI